MLRSYRPTYCQRNWYKQHNHLFTRSTYGTTWGVLSRTSSHSIHPRRSLLTYHPAFKNLWVTGPLILVIGQRHGSSYSFIVSHHLRQFVHMFMNLLTRVHRPNRSVVPWFKQRCSGKLLSWTAHRIHSSLSPRWRRLNLLLKWVYSFRLVSELRYFALLPLPCCPLS